MNEQEEKKLRSYLEDMWLAQSGHDNITEEAVKFVNKLIEFKLADHEQCLAWRRGL